MNPREKKHLFRLSRHVLSQLVCMGRHTIANLLRTSGRQHVDWSADYKMYGKDRIESERIFSQVRKEVLKRAGDRPLVTALDDSLLRKTGKKIPGVKYARDPMGPPFHVNFIRGHRVIQMSAAVTEGTQARMIPVIFRDAFTPDKPGKKASEEEWEIYRQECRASRLSVHGSRCIHEMRSHMGKGHKLWVTADGSYTNKTVMNDLPDETVLIGRIRRDAKLYSLPQAAMGRGRKRIYGDAAPTPEEIRKDDSIPWQKVTACTAGNVHEFKVKSVHNLKWRGSGKKHTVQVMVIAPLRYRLSKGSPLLYRDPGYLICTDPSLSPEEILQAYLWRWDIEINFRDEKTLLGTGQAQVRNPVSVKAVPRMTVASYSLLLLAGIKLFGITGKPERETLAKWQDPKKKYRASTNDLIKQLRSELWADSICSVNLSDFVSHQSKQRSLLNVHIPAYSGVLHAISG